MWFVRSLLSITVVLWAGIASAQSEHTNTPDPGFPKMDLSAAVASAEGRCGDNEACLASIDLLVDGYEFSVNRCNEVMQTHARLKPRVLRAREQQSLFSQNVAAALSLLDATAKLCTVNMPELGHHIVKELGVLTPVKQLPTYFRQQ